MLKCLEKVLEKKFIFGLRVEELLEIYQVDKQAGAILGKANSSANETRLKKHNTLKKNVVVKHVKVVGESHEMKQTVAHGSIPYCICWDKNTMRLGAK